jgi:hypothetical protein
MSNLVERGDLARQYKVVHSYKAQYIMEATELVSS